MKFAVSVTFEINPARMDEFMPLMLENAKASLSEEPGCLQFDVCTDQDRPGDVYLYEIYTSPDAFRDHLESEHFKIFDARVKEMIEGKDVKTYTTVA